MERQHAAPEAAELSVRVHGEVLPEPAGGGRDVQLHARLLHALEVPRKHKLQRLERYGGFVCILFAFSWLFLHFCPPVIDGLSCPVTGFTGSVLASLQECSIPVFLLCDLIKFYWAIRHPRSDHRFDSHLLSPNSLNE